MHTRGSVHNPDSWEPGAKIGHANRSALVALACLCRSVTPVGGSFGSISGRCRREFDRRWRSYRQPTTCMRANRTARKASFEL